MRTPRIPGTNSVRASILLGFGILIVILVVSISGAAVTLVNYKSDTAEMQDRATVASTLQNAETNAATAANTLQRYVVTGDETLLPQFETYAGQAVDSLTAAMTLENVTRGNSDTERQLIEITADSASLVLGAQQIIQLRRTGNIDEANLALDNIAPQFTAFRDQLTILAKGELAEVARLEKRANDAGQLALTLLIVTGIVGAAGAAIVAFVVARSVIRPLSRLEGTAQAVALGDMRARAPVQGPRELKRLAESLNLMTSTAYQRTEELRLSNEELRERNRQLLDARYQAATDPLTGLLNHRTFHERIREVVASRLHEGGYVSLIMVDIDNFKRVNDSLGHMAGDHVLREISTTISDIAGDQHAYRYGGDEFAILLPDFDRDAVFSIADRLLKQVKTRVRSLDGDKATISLGVASFPEMARSAEELLYRSDMALNWAKSCGKNRVGRWDQLANESDIKFAPHSALLRTHD